MVKPINWGGLLASPLGMEGTEPDYGYGTRPDGTPKGRGFYGELQRPDGDVSTEISIGLDFGGGETEIPLLVPTLTADERNWLLTNEPEPGRIPQTIIDKAAEHAISRMQKGQGPFATDQESNDAYPTLMQRQAQPAIDPQTLTTANILKMLRGRQ